MSSPVKFDNAFDKSDKASSIQCMRTNFICFVYHTLLSSKKRWQNLTNCSQWCDVICVSLLISKCVRSTKTYADTLCWVCSLAIILTILLRRPSNYRLSSFFSADAAKIWNVRLLPDNAVFIHPFLQLLNFPYVYIDFLSFFISFLCPPPFVSYYFILINAFVQAF